MSRPEPAALSLPRRRKSELALRPRPATSYDPVSLPQTPRYHAGNRLSYHATSDYDDYEWHSVSHTFTHSSGMTIKPHLTETFSEVSVSATPRPPVRHVRRHSTLTQSVIDGFAAITRRLSISKKTGGQLQKDEIFEGSRRPNTLSKRRSQMLDMIDSASPSIRPRTRGLLSSLTPRRRPSMPLMNWMPEPEPQVPEYSFMPKTPNLSRPSLPDFMSGGAGARASAAAQNEALANARATPLPTYYAATTHSDLRDSESGIGITVDYDGRGEAASIHAARCDPSTILPPELLESIFSNLDAFSLTQAELVSKRWSGLAGSQVAWRKAFYQQYAYDHPGRNIAGSSTPGLGKNIRGQDYRKLYSVRKLIDKRWENGEAAAIYLIGHKDSVYCIQFDENKIITGSRDNTVRIWDTRTYQCIRKLGPPNNPRELVQARRSDVDPQGTVPFFRMEATSLDLPQPAPAMWHQASVLCLQYDDEILVTGSSDFSCIVWSIKDNYAPMFRLLGHSAGVLDVCIDAHRIITCSKDTTIKIWCRYTGRLIQTLLGHQGPVNAVQVRGNLLASASGDGMSKLWRMEDGLCIKEFHSRERGLACVEFSEDGRTIYAGGNDHVVYEYNTITGNVERELQGHTNLVRSLHLDTPNNRIISGSYDHSIKVWNTKRGQEGAGGEIKINLEGWTSSWMLAAKSDYRRIACASQDGRVVIVDFGYGINGVHLVEA